MMVQIERHQHIPTTLSSPPTPHSGDISARDGPAVTSRCSWKGARRGAGVHVATKLRSAHLDSVLPPTQRPRTCHPTICGRSPSLSSYERDVAWGHLRRSRANAVQLSSSAVTRKSRQRRSNPCEPNCIDAPCKRPSTGQQTDRQVKCTSTSHALRHAQR